MPGSNAEGRPEVCLGRPQIDLERNEAIRESLASGLSIRKTAKLHGVGISTVQRLKKVAS